jgi:hypothetical protein
MNGRTLVMALSRVCQCLALLYGRHHLPARIPSQCGLTAEYIKTI